ncbi:unnamed protein product, partial [Ectocarpus sp. 6 AP-2014]
FSNSPVRDRELRWALGTGRVRRREQAKGRTTLMASHVAEDYSSKGGREDLSPAGATAVPKAANFAEGRVNREALCVRQSPEQEGGGDGGVAAGAGGAGGGCRGDNDGGLGGGILGVRSTSIANGEGSGTGNQAKFDGRPVPEEPPHAGASSCVVSTRPAAGAAVGRCLNGAGEGGGLGSSEAGYGGHAATASATGLGAGLSTHESNSDCLPVAVGASALSEGTAAAADAAAATAAVGLRELAQAGGGQPGSCGGIQHKAAAADTSPGLSATVPAEPTPAVGIQTPVAVGNQAPTTAGLSSASAVGVVDPGPLMNVAPLTDLPRLVAPATHVPRPQMPPPVDSARVDGEGKISLRPRKNPANGNVTDLPTPATEVGSRSRLRLRKYNNPAPPSAHAPQQTNFAPTLKREEGSARAIGSRAKTCDQVEVDGNKCPRRPSFGFPGDKRASRCASHKLEGHEDITSRRCDEEGCSRIPSFRQPGGTTRIRFCAAHKPPGYEDYHKGARSCRVAPGGFNACNRNSSFGFKGGKRISCAQHKQKGMINLNTPRCRGPECYLTPYFGLRGATPTYCSKHKQEGMINVISKRCEDESCDRIPSYNYDMVGAKAVYCNAHKAEGMVNVRHPRCAGPDCKRQPSFGKAGGKTAVYCVVHKEPDMVDVVNNYQRQGKKRRARE